MIKLLPINPLVTCPIKGKCNYLLFLIFHFNRVRMSWNFGDFRNEFHKLKTKLAVHHIVLITAKASPGEPTLTVLEMHKLRDFENIDPKKQLSCQKWTINTSRRKVCVNFKTDAENFNTVISSYRKSLYFKKIKIDLKLAEYQSLLARQVYLLSYIDNAYQRCVVQDETTVHKKNKLLRNGCFLFNEHFPIVSVIETVIWPQ